MNSEMSVMTTHQFVKKARRHKKTTVMDGTFNSFGGGGGVSDQPYTPFLPKISVD